jgi:hypothetical protein
LMVVNALAPKAGFFIMGWGMARKLVTCRVTDGAARVQARRDLRHGRTRRTRMQIEHG